MESIAQEEREPCRVATAERKTKIDFSISKRAQPVLREMFKFLSL